MTYSSVRGRIAKNHVAHSNEENGYGRAVRKLRAIRQRLHQAEVPQPDNWRALGDEAIWLRIVGQVMVVGGSRPYEENFLPNSELKQEISYETLRQMPNENRARVIHDVLRKAKIRYAGRILEACKKTKSLTRNFDTIQGMGGPRAFFERVSEIKPDRDKIAFVIDKFEHIGNKGARDLLMECGMVRNAVAFDTRIMNVFETLGIKIDKRVHSNTRIYFEEEQRVLAQVCAPLRMEGVELDRWMYQNYKEISKLLDAGTSRKREALCRGDPQS